MKILYVTTVSMTMGFFPEHIRMLQNEGHEVELACNIDVPLPEKVEKLGCRTHHIPFSRSPLSKDNIRAYRELKRLLAQNHYDIVHTHTPNASAIVRLVCRKLRKRGTKVFYTAHGFHFYKGAPLKNWILYFPVEWLLSHVTDVLITINKEDYAIAQKFGAKKAYYVPGVGIDTSKFLVDRSCCADMRKSLGLKETDFVMLSVGELSRRKNHAVVLRAMEKLKDREEFDRLQYLVCGQGDLKSELKHICNDSGIADRVQFLGYRKDVAKLCNTSDIFVFMSLQEGLPVALMEAMGCGLPAICSSIRGNTDLVEDGVNGYLVENNASALAESLLNMIQQENASQMMGIRRRAKESVEQFSVENVLKELKSIYQLN